MRAENESGKGRGWKEGSWDEEKKVEVVFVSREARLLADDETTKHTNGRSRAGSCRTHANA